MHQNICHFLTLINVLFLTGHCHPNMVPFAGLERRAWKSGNSRSGRKTFRRRRTDKRNGFKNRIRWTLWSGTEYMEVTRGRSFARTECQWGICCSYYGLNINYACSRNKLLTSKHSKAFLFSEFDNLWFCKLLNR